jgi:hypothetical protein
MLQITFSVDKNNFLDYPVVGLKRPRKLVRNKDLLPSFFSVLEYEIRRIVVEPGYNELANRIGLGQSDRIANFSSS